MVPPRLLHTWGKHPDNSFATKKFIPFIILVFLSRNKEQRPPLRNLLHKLGYFSVTVTDSVYNWKWTIFNCMLAIFELWTFVSCPFRVFFFFWQITRWLFIAFPRLYLMTSAPSGSKYNSFVSQRHSGVSSTTFQTCRNDATGQRPNAVYGLPENDSRLTENHPYSKDIPTMRYESARTCRFIANLSGQSEDPQITCAKDRSFANNLR